MEGMGCTFAIVLCLIALPIYAVIVLLWPFWVGFGLEALCRHARRAQQAQQEKLCESIREQRLQAIGEFDERVESARQIAADEFKNEQARLKEELEQHLLAVGERYSNIEKSRLVAKDEFSGKVADARGGLCGKTVSSRLMLLNTMSALLEPVHYVGGIEGAVCVYLDSAKRILDIHHWVGDSNSVPMPPDAILAHALAIGSTAVALAHNHPNESSVPSDQDVWHAAGMVNVLQAAGISLSEDYVWCHNKYKSVLNTRRFRELAGPLE